MLSREFAMYVCMSVNELLLVCSIIASMRLRLDLEGGYSMIRYVTQGEKWKRYISLHRGRGSKMTKISVA